MLAGLRIIEFEGLGAAPFCGMLLADLGAEVIAVERPGAASAGPASLFRRGKRMVRLDLKRPEARAAAIKIAARCDGLIEGYRPGAMERLGLGPDSLRKENPRLVYGRLTGWGQEGPLAERAGHDLNYVALSGAAYFSGAAGAAPLPPPTLVGDVGGGALYLAVGLLAAILRARETGEGAVVDAAIVDGAAHMTSLLLALRAAGGLGEARGESVLDGAPFYSLYPCQDGLWLSVAALEPKFYAVLLDRLGLAGEPDLARQYDRESWPVARARLAAAFAAAPRAHWTKLLEGTDACVAPVLSPSEAARHPHMAARGVYREAAGALQAAAAPRFDGARPAQPPPVPESGAQTKEVLREAGLCEADIAALVG